MSKNTLTIVGITVVIGIISALITYFRAGSMSPEADLAAKGLAAIQRGNVLFFGAGVPVVTALIAVKVLHAMQAKYALAAPSKYLILAIVIGVLLSIMAGVVFKMRGFIEFTIMHILYIVGFGWLMPLLVK